MKHRSSILCKIVNIVILAAVCLTIPMSVFAAGTTTLKTSVPSNHTIYLSIEGQGTVMVEGKRYSKSANISINRYSEPSVQIQATKGYSIRTVAYNQENIMHLFNSGKWTMPKVESDITLSVVFVRDSGNPPTGDTFNPWIIVLFILSLLGLLVCVLKVRKHKLI